MPLTRAQKGEVMTVLKQLFIDSKIAIFLNFHGLPVKESMMLRRDFHARNMRYRVVKKSLLAHAISNLFGKEVPELKGEIGVVFGNDLLEAVKEVVRVAKANRALTVQGGWWENAWMEVRNIVMLATIPNREALLAQLMMIINAPMRNMTGALAYMPRKFTGTLEAIRLQKGQS